MDDQVSALTADRTERQARKPRGSRVKRARSWLGSAVAFCATSVVATAAIAASARSDRRSSERAARVAAAEPLQERPKPPQAAFDACRNRAEGDACTVELGDRKISGTCRKPPDGEQGLICFPAGPPPGPPR
jgi:hypothetical protein